MTIKKLVLAMGLVMAAGSAMAALPTSGSSTSVVGGQIEFQGTVVDAACAVAQNSVDQTVQMGQVRVADFAGTGSEAGAKTAFTIGLEDCDTTVSQNAAVTFNGNADSGAAGVLVNAAGEGSAQGVGIQIYDNDGTALALGTESQAVTLIDGTNTLNFSADFVSTADTVTPGNVDATATFNITYS